MKYPPLYYCTVAPLVHCHQLQPFCLSLSTQDPALHCQELWTDYTSQKNASFNMAHSYFNIRLAYYSGFSKHMYSDTSQLSTILQH